MDFKLFENKLQYHYDVARGFHQIWFYLKCKQWREFELFVNTNQSLGKIPGVGSPSFVGDIP